MHTPHKPLREIDLPSAITRLTVHCIYGCILFDLVVICDSKGMGDVGHNAKFSYGDLVLLNKINSQTPFIFSL